MSARRLADRVPPRLGWVLVAAAWLLLTHEIVPLGTALVPDSVKPHITYPQFLAACQIVTTLVGLGLAWLFARDPREGLGFVRPRATGLAATTLLVPLVFVAASAIALRVALPYLLDEIARRGPGVVRDAAGAMGQRLEQAPLLFTLVWGAILAAASEELLFRGALWSALERLVPPAPAAPAHAPDAPPDSLPDFARPSPVVLALRRALAPALATVLSAIVFGLMHWDMKGAVGVVHVVSTTCLGLACGAARGLTRGIAAPALLHFLYNVVVIGNARRWFGYPEDPILSGIPDSMLVLAAGGVLVAIAVVVIARRRAARTTAAPASAAGA